MRKLLESVTGRLKDFLAQRDDLALVVRSPEGESVGILGLLEAVEEESTSAMFWTFTEPFGDAEGYAGAVVEGFTSKHELVRLLQGKEGMKVWPALPAAIKEGTMPPAKRLRELMMFARSLLPTLGGGLLVWVMFPGMVLDRPAYADLMREVLRHEFPFPWCHHMRILLRDDPVDPVLFKRMEKEPRIAWYTPDLSPQAMEKAMEEEAADESIPLDERCQALLQTAATDYSHKRYPQALEKYQLLFDYYAAQGNHALAALALNGMGEVHRTTGDKKIAGACFEAAMVPATEGQLPHVAVMLPVAFNLATLRAEEKRWEDAEGYWDCLQQLATAQRSPELKVQALEERGHAQYQQGKVPEALATWTATATLAEKLKKPELAKGVLERLRAHYQKVHDSARLREVDRQLSAARQPAPNA